MDREYTAQIRKRDEFGVWRPCGNTTFIVHDPFPLYTQRDWQEDLIGYRRSMMYGAGIAKPKFGFGRFTTS